MRINNKIQKERIPLNITNRYFFNIHHIRYVIMSCLFYCHDIQTLKEMATYVLLTSQLISKQVKGQTSLWIILDLMVSVVSEDFLIPVKIDHETDFAADKDYNAFWNFLLTINMFNNQEKHLLFLGLFEQLSIEEISTHYPYKDITEIATNQILVEQKFAKKLSSLMPQGRFSPDDTSEYLNNLRRWLGNCSSKLVLHILSL